MKQIKTLLTTIVLVVFLNSCSNSKLRLVEKENIAKLETIINENLQGYPEVYELSFSASTLKDNITDIDRTYKVKEKLYNDRYDISSNGFSDPIKTATSFGRNRKPFKLSAINLSIIPDKYQEALSVLKEKKLFKDDRTYLLNSLSITADNKGGLEYYFVLQFKLGSSSSGRVRRTTYDSHSFDIRQGDKLIFLN